MIIIYTPSFHYKPVCISFFCKTQKMIFCWWSISFGSHLN